MYPRSGLEKLIFKYLFEKPPMKISPLKKIILKSRHEKISLENIPHNLENETLLRLIL